MFTTVDQRYAAVSRVRTAAMRAPRVYPGPVGEWLRSELHAYADMSWLWADGKVSARMAAVVDDIMGRAVG